MKINSPGIFIIFFILFLSSGASAQIINTVAGTPQVTGYMGDMGAAIFAEFDNPSDLVVDSLGNLYIADFLNNVIRIVDVAGNINTFAGNGAGAGTMAAGGYTGDGGAATAAELNGPYGLAIDSRGNIYFADGYNHAVRKVNTSGIITTFAGKDTAGYRGDGGPATAALLDNPVAIAIDHSGNVYIADDHNHVVRKVDTSGIITTFAGNDTLGYRGDGGPATAAELNLPIGLAIDALSNLYISDEDNNNIRKVTTTGVISTFVATDTAHGYSGDGGPAASATLYGPAHIAVGNSTLYISDVLNNVIRTVDIESGLINTFVGAFYGEDDTVKFCEYGGDGGPATAAQICDPNGVAIGDSGKIYIYVTGATR
jgi:sugar lactone lactonase YvrE